MITQTGADPVVRASGTHNLSSPAALTGLLFFKGTAG